MKEKLFISKDYVPKDVFDKRIVPFVTVGNPHIPFYVFSPIALGLFYFTFFVFDLEVKNMLLALCLAPVFWTILEYTMHRFFFHAKPKAEFLQNFMYTLHWGHHDYPNDKRLMLVGPLMSIPGGLIIFGIGYWISGRYMFPFMGALLCTYMVYDWLHYAVHHYDYKNRYFQKMKTHHMRHHYQDSKKAYGFITDAWDKVIGTAFLD